MNFIKIKSVKKLKNLLSRYGVDYYMWGKGATKTLNQLFIEINLGESYLSIENNKLLRTISVVNMFFFFKRKGNFYFLREDRQEFSNGSIRQRNPISSLSEKMSPNENPVSAIIRGIKEELGFDFYMKGKSYLSRTNIRKSSSYPGLKTYYKFYDFTSYINEENYFKNGYVENQVDKSTYFTWEKIE